MKKIKIVFSDFHMGKGSRLPDGRVNPLEEFQDADSLLELIRYYSTGEYENCDVELIANGDFFDLLTVDYFHRFTEQITEERSIEKLETIIQGHKEVFDGLIEFCRKPHRSLTFVVGNHDQGLLWPKVQKALRSHISSSVKIQPESYVFDGVYVTHGHQFEYINHFNARNYYYINERGKEILRIPWGSYFVLNVTAPARFKRPYLARVRPFRKYLRWVFFNEFLFFWRLIWGLVWFWFSNRIHPDPNHRREFVFSVRRMYNAMTHKPLPQQAERILYNTKYHTVVLSHSHSVDYREFGVSGEYFNTGTWTEVIHLDLEHLGPRKNLTYVLFEYKDEKPHGRLLKWNGVQKLFEELV